MRRSRRTQRAEATADELRAELEIKERVAAQCLAIPIASREIRPAARRIENALSALYQIDYLLEVGMAEDVQPKARWIANMVRNLARMAQLQITGLTRRIQRTARQIRQRRRPGSCRHPLRGGRQRACRSILLRIAGAAEHLQNRDHETEALAAVIDLLYEPEVQQLVPEWISDDNNPSQ